MYLHMSPKVKESTCHAAFKTSYTFAYSNAECDILGNRFFNYLLTTPNVCKPGPTFCWYVALISAISKFLHLLLRYYSAIFFCYPTPFHLNVFDQVSLDFLQYHTIDYGQKFRITLEEREAEEEILHFTSHLFFEIHGRLQLLLVSRASPE